MIEKAEWIAIATTGPGPHLVATWGDQLRALTIEGGTLLIPVGHGLVGKGEFQTAGPHFDAIKAKSKWALVVSVEEAKPQL